MCRELTELRWIGCLIESTWNPKFKTKMLTPKNQLADILTKRCFSRNEWNHLLCLFNIMNFSTYSGSHLTSFLSEDGERIAFGAMSKWGQDTTSSDSSPVAKARPTNLAMQGQYKEDISPQSSGSRVNQENDDERKGVSSDAGNCGSSNSNFESRNSQGYRQERVILAARKLEQKDPPRAKSEENSSCTKKLDASSPTMELMRFSNNQFLTTILQCSQRNWDGLQLMLRSQSNHTKQMGWFGNCSLRHRWKPPFILDWISKKNSEIYRNTRFENIQNVFNVTQKLIEEHSEEFLHVRSYSSPSWTRSTLVNDQAVKWAKAKVCLRWLRSICWSTRSRSSTDRRWVEKSQVLQHCLFFCRFKKTRKTKISHQRNLRTGSSSCRCSMILHGRKMTRIASRTQ